MLRTYQYRLQPTKNQLTLLSSQLSECQWLYNHLLEQRKKEYETNGKTLTCFDQCKYITKLKKERISLTNVNAQALQNVSVRLDLAYKAFFRRVKAGGKAGFPRFKSWDRYDSMTFPQFPSGCSIVEGKLKVAKLGHIKMKLHRPLQGNVKTATIKRTSTGKWFVTFSSEVEIKKPTPTGEPVAFDLGLKTYAVFSDGTKIKTPRFFRKGQKRLAVAQRKLAKQEKGTPERKKKKLVVAKIHERICNQRKDFCHKEARKLVEKYSAIYHEDLQVNRMVHECGFAKSILDASWSMFIQFLSYKAERAGVRVIAVNPAWTSQDCSSCGHRQKKALEEQTHRCSCCGFTADRDFNAALNIFRLGQQSDPVYQERSSPL